MDQQAMLEGDDAYSQDQEFDIAPALRPTGGFRERPFQRAAAVVEAAGGSEASSMDIDHKLYKTKYEIRTTWLTLLAS